VRSSDVYPNYDTRMRGSHGRRWLGFDNSAHFLSTRGISHEYLVCSGSCRDGVYCSFLEMISVFQNIYINIFLVKPIFSKKHKKAFFFFALFFLFYSVSTHLLSRPSWHLPSLQMSVLSESVRGRKQVFMSHQKKKNLVPKWMSRPGAPTPCEPISTLEVVVCGTFMGFRLTYHKSS